MPDVPRLTQRPPIAIILAGILLAALIALGWITTRLWTREQQAQQQLRLTLATAQAQAEQQQATASAEHATNTTYQQENEQIQATAAAATNQLATIQAENANLQATAAAANTEAAEQSRLALANQLAVQSLTLAEENLPAAMLLSVEASHIADTAATRNSLLYFLQGNPVLKSIWDGDYSPTDLAFSPDGRYLAAVHIHGQVVLYDTTTSRPIGEPLLGLDQNSAGETNTGVHVAFSQSGRLIVAVKGWGWEGNNMVVWDTTTRQVIAATDQYFPHFVAFWGEEQLITAGDDGLTLWHLQDNQFVEVAHYEGTDIYLVEPHPDGRTIAFESGEGFVSLWNSTSGEVTRIAPAGERAPINSLAFSPDGTILAVGSSQAILWDMAAGEKLGELVASQVGSVRKVEFSADGQFLMTAGGPDQSLQLWDVAAQRPEGEPLQRWGSARELMDATLSPDGKTIVSSYLDGEILFWEPTAETRLKQWKIPTAGASENLGFLADGYTLVTYSFRRGMLEFWNGLTGSPARPEHHLGYPDARQYAFDRDYHIAAAHVFTNGIGTTLLVDLQSDEIIKELSGSPNERLVFALNAEGTILATAIERTKIALWSTTTGEMVGLPIIGHTEYIEEIAFSPSGQQLATVANGEIFLWDVNSREPLFSISMAGTITGLTFSTDGRFLATYSMYGNAINVWNTASGSLIGKIPSGEISRIAFAQNGPLIATSTLQYIDYGRRLPSVYLWDESTFHQIGKPFERHLDPALSSDGRLLATLHYDDTGLSEVVISDMSLQSWQEQACHVVNRNFTELEWSYYFPNQPYRQTCPNLS